MKFPFFKRKKEIEIPSKIFEAELIKATDIIAPASIEIGQDYLKIGEKFAKTYFVFSYPRYLSTAWLSPVINLDIQMDISFIIHPVDTGLVLRQLVKRVTEIQSEIMEREEKGLVRDPVLETAFRDLEELRDKLQTAREKMFRFGLYITIYVDDKKDFRDIETALRSILEARLIYIKPALFQQHEGFLSTSPYCLDRLLIHTPMNTEPLSSCFPFVSFDLSSNEGILYGINRHNNSLILFDRFSLENANEVVFAKAGSGKTVRKDTPVLIKNKNKIQLTKIGPFIEKLIKKYGAVPIDKEIEGVINPPKIEVYSFNKNLKGKWSKVTVAMRKKAPKIFYKVITKSGREIITTGDHNMVVLKNGKVVVAKTSKIKEGDFIPLPRIIAESQNSLEDLDLLSLLKNSKKIYVIGGGNLISENYKILKKKGIDKHYDHYLYEYRKGRAVPIKYFCKILKYLKIKNGKLNLQNIKLVSKNGKKRVSLNPKLNISSSFLRVLGYIIAEGTITEDSIMISNKDPEVLKDIDLAFSKLKIPFYYGKEGIICAYRVFTEIVKTLCRKKRAKEKEIPSFIFNLKKEKIGQFLTAYFEGDGGIEKNQIVICSKSKKLISEIAYLLYYFGIIGRISKVKKKVTNSNWKRKKIYWTLRVSGQDNLRRFAKNINFISERKREKLSKIIKKEGNTNVDIIPNLEKIFQEIYDLFGFQLQGISEISEWKRGAGNPSPQHLLRVVDEIEKRIYHFKSLVSTFQTLGYLPELATVINFGKSKKELNSALWKNLGWSWGLMKNQRVRPKSANVFKVLNLIEKENYSLKEIKKTIHYGFKEMKLKIKNFSRTLQTQLTERIEENTTYELIQKSAQFVWQNYQKILETKIPKLEEKLAQLKILARGDLFWDPIIKIKKFENKKDEYVYDLTVDDEVFLAGNGGMFVHNSYAVKLEILRYLMMGVDVIVIDPENEYEFLSDAVGGSFFKISLTSPHHINPFELPPPREDERPEDVLRSSIINLVGLLRIMLGGLTPEEDAIVDRAITETYAAKDITPETDPSTWNDNPPLMEDLETVLKTMEGTESLVRRLQKYTKGAYASFFNQPSNISMENRMVVFGIRDMEEELRPMALYIILRYIWKTVRATLKKRILVVDEAWWLMQSEDGASFLYGICKRARKYWLGVTTITQDVGDFMKSEYGQPIITNSSLQLLLKQSPATIDIVQKAFLLTDQEKYMLLEAEVGEGLFFAGQKHVAIKVVASYTEDQIITTSPEEVLKIKKAKKELGY